MSNKRNTFLRSWSEAYKDKVIPPDRLREVVHGLREDKKTIATINGSFDLLHAGHLHMLYEGSQMADVFIVALNSDSSIRQYKSVLRPIIPLEHRIQMMAALEFIDYVTWFNETDPREILSVIRPDVHVNGAEYGQNCIEAETVRTHGGNIHIVPLLPGLSTTAIIQKIQTGA